MNITERIEKLIMLATSQNENEARNAAFLACKLIREHGLLLRDENDEDDTPPPPSYRVINAKFLSACGACAKCISVGEPCAWTRGKPILCVACWRGRKQAA